MKMLTFTYRVSGRNRPLLINRMNKAGIALLKMQIIGEKEAEITIYAKDRVKYFAICENLCYNKLIGVGGLLAPVYRILKAPQVIVGAVVFIVALIVGSNIYLGNELVGDSEIYRAQIDEAFKKADIDMYGLFGENDLKAVENYIGDKTNANFIKVEKSGNRAIITTYAAISPPEKIQSSIKDIIADGDCVIVKITAYSGTPLVQEGDKVTKGQPIIGAYDILKDESKVPCAITGYVIAEKTFTFDYRSGFTADDAVKSNAIAAARFMLGDKTVTHYDVKVQNNYVRVTLYYECLLFGNELFGG